MGQSAPKTFPAPGEYRGVGSDNTAVAQTQPLLNTASIATTPLPTTPMIQSPNSTTTAMQTPITPAISSTGTALPTSAKQSLLSKTLGLNSTVGNIGTMLLVVLALAVGARADATLSTHLANISGAAMPHRNFVRLELRGCAGYFPSLPGFGNLDLTQDYYPDANGNVTGAVKANNLIQCNGIAVDQNGNPITFYHVTYYSGGVPQSSGNYSVLDGTTFDPTSAPTLNGVPPSGALVDSSVRNFTAFDTITAPRFVMSPAKAACPVGQVAKGFAPDFTPICVDLTTVGITFIPISSTPNASQSIAQPAGTTLAVSSLNGTVSADQFPGADMGAQLNAAFTANPAGKVTLPPGQTYSYATTWSFPASATNTYPILDCQGSTLNYTGSGDAVLVTPGGAFPYKSGLIENCILTGTSVAANSFHQEARIGMNYRNVSVSGFTGTTSAALFLDNTSFAGATTGSAAGWNERSDIDINVFGDTFGVRALGSHGGTNSFAYTVLNMRCQTTDGQWCLSVEGVADMYSAKISIMGNATFMNVAGGMVRATGGALIRSGWLTVNGESQGSVGGTDIYNDASSAIDACGLKFTPGFSTVNLGTSDQQNVSIFANACANGQLRFTPTGYSQGVQQSRNWKLTLGTTGFDAYLPSNYGVEGNAHFGIWRRVTQNPGDPEADGPNKTTAFYINSFNGYVGIGPGFDVATPLFDLQVNGTMGIFRASGVDKLQFMKRYLDPIGGVHDYLRSATDPGQPSLPYYLDMSDFTSGTEVDVTVEKCIATGGSALCNIGGTQTYKSVPGLNCVANPTPAPTDRGPGTVNYVNTPAGQADIVQICGKNAAGVYAWHDLLPLT